MSAEKEKIALIYRAKEIEAMAKAIKCLEMFSEPDYAKMRLGGFRISIDRQEQRIGTGMDVPDADIRLVDKNNELTKLIVDFLVKRETELKEEITSLMGK